MELEFYKSNNDIVEQQSANEESARLFFVRCADVGLDCNCVIFGRNEKNIMNKTIIHMFEYHAINSKEMTTCMKLKIRENIHTSFS
jgi:predicted small metal-binding protein